MVHDRVHSGAHLQHGLDLLKPGMFTFCSNQQLRCSHHQSKSGMLGGSCAALLTSFVRCYVHTAACQSASKQHFLLERTAPMHSATEGLEPVHRRLNSYSIDALFCLLQPAGTSTKSGDNDALKALLDEERNNGRHVGIAPQCSFNSYVWRSRIRDWWRLVYMPNTYDQ